MGIPELENILLDQKAELDILRHDNLVSRPQENLINLHSRLAQVVIGVRRSGKSTLCFNALEKAQVNYAYVNFDDERLEFLKTEQLDKVLEALYKIYGNFEYLFLDEIQNVDGWPLFINRLLRQRIHIVMTGSNAKLLSTDLATHLTGRHHKIELLPFSFRDWCVAKEIDTTPLTTKNRGLLGKSFEEYLHVGGFPELVFEPDNEGYVSALFQSIITQDIKNRYKLRNVTELERLANHILNEVPRTFAYNRLRDISGIGSQHTLVRYLSYLKQTYIVSSIQKYSPKSRLRAINEKFYTIDVSLMDKRDNAFAGENLGWRLENIVYLELKRRASRKGYDIYYHKERTTETDFIVCDGNKTIGVYQVCYDLTNEKTRKREIRGCLEGGRVAKCDKMTIITNSEREKIEEDGKIIDVIPAYEWLLQEDW